MLHVTPGAVFLLTRHRLIDLRLDEAIRSGRVGQVIEIASGLSARGWRFNQRYGEALSYIEADLPGMAQRKREALARMGGPQPGHRVVDIDALADGGPQSLDAVAASLDRDRGLALITEGLVNYFSEADVRSMWQRFSSLMRQFPEACYWSDIALSDDMGGRVAPFVSVLSAFVRGRVHLHFRAPTDAEAALRECGFGSARAIDPGTWGKCAWKTMFTLAATLPSQHDDADKPRGNKFVRRLRAMCDTLPCPLCREHFRHHMLLWYLKNLIISDNAFQFDLFDSYLKLYVQMMTSQDTLLPFCLITVTCFQQNDAFAPQ